MLCIIKIGPPLAGKSFAIIAGQKIDKLLTKNDRQ